MKGFRTLAFNVIAVILPVLETLDKINFFDAQHSLPEVTEFERSS